MKKKTQPKYCNKPIFHETKFAISVEELECLATWKEGSNRYLVGRLHNGHSLSNEDRYRCFVYERGGQTATGLNRASAAALGIATVHEVVAGPVPEGSPEVYKVAQSGDATCNGLFSPLEGSRTMTLTKGKWIQDEKCIERFMKFPFSFCIYYVWLN